MLKWLPWANKQVQSELRFTQEKDFLIMNSETEFILLLFMHSSPTTPPQTNKQTSNNNLSSNQKQN
jgi:hypothetical protein